MNSRLFHCRVSHCRLVPRRHRFAYGLFLLSLDLDELPAVHAAHRWLSVNRGNLFSFREADYLPTGAAPDLKGRVRAYAATKGVFLPASGRVELLTLPRMFGYVFNPVSFYFCFDEAGRPLAAIVEVTNTFREMKAYFLGPESWRGGIFASRQPKHFYVSPFSELDVLFDLRLPIPGLRLALQIDDWAGGQRTFGSALRGSAAPLRDAALLACLVRYPLLTLRVILLIHWHALRLWCKKVPWFAKAARPADQRQVWRAHRSLTGRRAVPK